MLKNRKKNIFSPAHHPPLDAHFFHLIKCGAQWGPFPIPSSFSKSRHEAHQSATISSILSGDIRHPSCHSNIFYFVKKNQTILIHNTKIELDWPSSMLTILLIVTLSFFKTKLSDNVGGGRGSRSSISTAHMLERRLSLNCWGEMWTLPLSRDYSVTLESQQIQSARQADRKMSLMMVFWYSET